MVASDTAYTRILRFAAETLGGAEALARALAVNGEELARWLTGAERAPHRIYLAALDIVAAGPYAAPQLRLAM